MDSPSLLSARRASSLAGAGLLISMLACLSSPVLAQEPSSPQLPALTPPTTDLLDASVDQIQLKPGEFVWLPAPQRSSSAPLMIIVNLGEQRAYVYRDGEPIAITTVSTGRPGRETPTGVYEILTKERMHHSNLYDDAPMPFMQRLSWGGVALHAGHVSGRPSSHGCIRLPPKFAEQLYGITQRGETVVVADDGSVGSLARAGLDAQLNLLMGPAWTIHAVVGAVGPAPVVAAGDGDDGGRSSDETSGLSP